MSGIKKNFYITVGFIAFVIGGVGVVLPVLPTTPFLLLASFCFTRGSKKFEIWFMGTKTYKNHLNNFVKERAMTLKQKILLLAFADFMIMFPLLILDNIYIKVLLISLIVFKFYYFIFKIKTIQKSDN